MANTWYVDMVNGSDTANGNSWGTAWKTITNGVTSGHSVAAGDTVKIAKTPDPVSLGSATFVNNQGYITLASAATAKMNNFMYNSSGATVTDFTSLGTGVTCKTITNWAKFVPASGYTYNVYLSVPSSFTGAVGTGPSKPAGYQYVCFWFCVNGATVAANTIQFSLSGGATYTIPWATTANYWYPIMINDGTTNATGPIVVTLLSATGSAITLHFNNMFASNGLNLTSVVGQQSTGTPANTAIVNESWWCLNGIDSDNKKLILGDWDSSPAYNGPVPYYGNAAGTTCYYRNPLMQAPGASVFTISKSGTTASPLIFQGGWNTSSGLVDGETWFSGMTAYDQGAALDTGILLTDNTSNTLCSLDRIGVVNVKYAYNSTGSGTGSWVTTNCSTSGCLYSLIYNNSGWATGVPAMNGTNFYVTQCMPNGGAYALNTGYMLCIFNNLVARQNGTLVYGGKWYINGGTINTFASAIANAFKLQGGYTVQSLGVTYTDSIIVYPNGPSQAVPYYPSLISYNHNGVAGAHKIWSEESTSQNYYTMQRDTVIYDSGVASLRITPMTNKWIYLPAGQGHIVSIPNGSTATVTVKIRKSISTDAGGANWNNSYQPVLRVRQNILFGISADTTVATCVGTTNGVWETLTYTTPTAPFDTALEFTPGCYAGTANSWINVDTWVVS